MSSVVEELRACFLRGCFGFSHGPRSSCCPRGGQRCCVGPLSPSRTTALDAHTAQTGRREIAPASQGKHLGIAGIARPNDNCV